MRSLLQDMRFGARLLARSPGFTAVALITMALGIGANTGMYSLVKAQENIPNRLAEPDRLVQLWRTNERHDQLPACPIDCLDFREQAKSISDLGLYRPASLTLTGQGEPEQIRAVRMTANMMPMLGLDARLGRLHTAEEDSPASDRVVLLTERCWQHRFDSDPDVLGQTLVLNGEPHTIIGVLPFEFELEDLWIHVELLTPLRIDLTRVRRGEDWGWAVARLNPGVSLEQAQAEMTGIAARLADAWPVTNASAGVRLHLLTETMVSLENRLANKAQLAAVGLVLMIACANLANLLMARATSRGREFAVRTALGAGRTRLIRQLLTESLLLALLGGALGLLIGTWAIDAFVAAVDYLPFQRNEVGLSWKVLTYTLVMSGLAALAFGLVPALTATRVSVNEALKEGQAASSAGSARNRLRDALVVGQLVIALPLLICCGLTVRHLAAIRNVDFGFNTERLLTLRVDLPTYRYQNETQWAAFYDETLESVRALPGIEAAGAAMALPVFGEFGVHTQVMLEGLSAEETRALGIHGYIAVTPGYFETMEIPLISGRCFTERDHVNGQQVALVNQRLAQRCWPDEDPVGRRLALRRDLPNAPWITIVGVVADAGRSFRGGPPSPALYLLHPQRPSPHMVVVARTRGNPRESIGALRSAIHNIDLGVPAREFSTIDEIVHRWSREDRMVARFSGGLAALALGLASIGLYGVMSYTVVQRTHEIGVRAALGAGRREIMHLVLGRCFRLAIIGIVIGLTLSVPVGLAIQSRLFGISGVDPLAYVGVSIVLLTVAALAGYLPARRATKVDPMVALRCE